MQIYERDPNLSYWYWANNRYFKSLHPLTEVGKDSYLLWISTDRQIFYEADHPFTVSSLLEGDPRLGEVVNNLRLPEVNNGMGVVIVEGLFLWKFEGPGNHFSLATNQFLGCNDYPRVGFEQTKVNGVISPPTIEIYLNGNESPRPIISFLLESGVLPDSIVKTSKGTSSSSIKDGFVGTLESAFRDIR